MEQFVENEMEMEITNKDKVMAFIREKLHFGLNHYYSGKILTNEPYALGMKCNVDELYKEQIFEQSVATLNLVITFGQVNDHKLYKSDLNHILKNHVFSFFKFLNITYLIINVLDLTVESKRYYQLSIQY